MLKCISEENNIFFDEENFRVIKTKNISHYFDNIGLFPIKNTVKNIKQICRKLTTDLIIRVPNKCNLRCLYCSSNSSSNDITKMDMEKVKKAIDYVVKNYKLSQLVNDNPKKINITITGGGEPFVYWNNIVEIVEYINLNFFDYRKNIQLQLLTNGQISTFKKRKWIIENFDVIFVSADGKSIQNYQRPRIDNNFSHDYVEDLLSELNKSNTKFGIRMTITNTGLEYLLDDVKYYLEIYENIQYVQLQPVINVGRAENLSLINIDKYLEKYNTLKKIFKNKIVNSFDFIDKNIFGPCSSLSGISFCIVPEGDLVACNMAYKEDELWDKLIVGNFDVENNLKITKNEIPIKVSDRCEKCSVFRICKGGCAFKIKHDEMGNIVGELSEFYCAFNKKIIENKLISLIENSPYIIINDERVYYHNV